MRALGTCAKAIATFACAFHASTGVGADSAGPIDASPALAEFRLDPDRSAIAFDMETVGHAHLAMRFGRVRAWLEGLEDGLVVNHVAVTIDATSVEADEPFVAELAEEADMLDVARYPTIRFASTQFSRTGAATGVLTGDLTIRATTRPITLAVKLDEPLPDTPPDRRALAFSADGDFSRAAFGLSEWSSAVGDDVHMRIHAEFVRERTDP